MMDILATNLSAQAEDERPALTQAEYLAELRARRREVSDPRSGEARALMLAIGYLQTASPQRARWALQDVLEGERRRQGEFWAQSRRALRRIIRELRDVR